MALWRPVDFNVTVARKCAQRGVEFRQRHVLPDAATDTQPERNERSLLGL